MVVEKRNGWVNNKGDWIDCVNHIAKVIEQPELFGLSNLSVREEYSHRKEMIGTEGVARDVLLTRVIRSGWIRINYIQRSATYIATLSKHFRYAKPALEWLDALVCLQRIYLLEDL